MPAAPAEGITVLVAEDHDLVRESLEMMLRDLGYSVLSASSGERALQICREASVTIDVLLVDVVMPDMSGPVLATRASEILPDLKHIFMSGYPGAVLEDHGVGAAETYLVKPFRAAEIRDAIAALIGRNPD